MWLPFWDWFFSFTEFFSVVFGPIIVAALPMLLILSGFMAAGLLVLVVAVSIINLRKGVV